MDTTLRTVRVRDASPGVRAAVERLNRGEGHPGVTALRPKWAVTCEGCGEVFTATDENAKTCSSRCRQRAYRARHAS